MSRGALCHRKLEHRDKTHHVVEGLARDILPQAYHFNKLSEIAYFDVDLQNHQDFWVMH